MKKLLFLSLLIPLAITAQVPDPQPNTYINDLPGLLPATYIAQLNQQLHEIEKTYSVQMAIILIDHLPDGIEIDDYAREIGRKWHVGNAKNGLVYVAAIGQHKQRLEVAQQLEGTITDIKARELTDNIKPFFKAKDYAGGLTNLVKEINYLLKPVQAEQKGLGNAELKKKDAGLPAWAIILICLGGSGILWWIIWLITKKEPKVEEDANDRMQDRTYGNSSGGGRTTNNTIVAPIVVSNHYSRQDDYTPPSQSYDSGSSSSSSSSSSSDYGSWGSGSSDSGSSSSDSGFSGGGSSNDW